MKWGKKKASSSSSSRSSLISHVLPASWLTKFKQMSMNSGQEHAKAKPMSGKWNSVPKTPSNCGNGGGGGIGRFYGGDGDAFWRLSFGEDGLDGKKKMEKNGYNSDNEAPAFPPSNCQSCRSNAGLDFNSMVSEVRKIRGGLSREVEILPEMDTNVREKVAEIRTPRLMRVEKGKKLRKTNQKVVAKNVFEQEKERRIGMDEREDCKLTAEVSDTEFTADQEENCGICAENLSAEWQKLKEMKMEEIKSRGEKQQRKSLYISRELQRRKSKHHSSKVRLYSSPRTPSKVEICRIKAIEDMKKAKIKMRKEKEKMMSMEGFEGLESFAVVKCSFDPQQDFRDSMVEMIKEKKISEPDELEELLACYLTLNSDTYHDLIIKVFRQVWFDMNQACFDAELEHELSYYD